MTGFLVRGLDPAFEVVCVQDVAPSLSQALERETGELWGEAQAERIRPMHNGPLFTVTSFSPDRIEGFFTEYRMFIAQRRRPALFNVLKVRPLGVSGLLICPDGIVFGRRGPEATQDAGRWELVPSGGIDDTARKGDRIDAVGQLLKEQEEETGLTVAEIGGITPLCLLEDRESHVLDIAMLLETDRSGPEILARHNALKNREYTALKIVPADRLDVFLKDEAVAGISCTLLDYAWPRLAATTPSTRHRPAG